jgi:hypothetical protein
LQAFAVIVQNIASQTIRSYKGTCNRIGVHIALVLCAFAALESGSAVAQSPERLQLLLNDTVAQLRLSYRHNVPEQRRRYDELAQVVSAWREAPRTDANNRLLEAWLRGAIRSSMPGSQDSLPPMPLFEQPSERELPTVLEFPMAPSAEPTTRTQLEIQSDPPPANDSESTDAALEKALGDPFGDDPEVGE